MAVSGSNPNTNPCAPLANAAFVCVRVGVGPARITSFTRRYPMKSRLFFMVAGALAMAVPVALVFFTFTPAEAQSSDATLSALTVSPGTITDFSPGQTDYAVPVDDTVTQVTVNATPTHSGATVTLNRPDADTETTGYQVDLGRRAQGVTITVTAEDTTTMRTYTVTMGWSSTEAYGWKVTDDLDGLRVAENRQPWGIWGNGTTFWIADYFDHKLYAYNRDGSRDAEKDIALYAQNHSASGIWSNGQTVWVADGDDQKLYAYALENGLRQGDSDITLDALDGQSEPAGIWSDGHTIWVAEHRVGKLIAYRLAGGTGPIPGFRPRLRSWQPEEHVARRRYDVGGFRRQGHPGLRPG